MQGGLKVLTVDEFEQFVIMVLTKKMQEKLKFLKIRAEHKFKDDDYYCLTAVRFDYAKTANRTGISDPTANRAVLLADVSLLRQRVYDLFVNLNRIIEAELKKLKKFELNLIKKYLKLIPGEISSYKYKQARKLIKRIQKPFLEWVDQSQVWDNAGFEAEDLSEDEEFKEIKKIEEEINQKDEPEIETDELSEKEKFDNGLYKITKKSRAFAKQPQRIQVELYNILKMSFTYKEKLLFESVYENDQDIHLAATKLSDSTVSVATAKKMLNKLDDKIVNFF